LGGSGGTPELIVREAGAADEVAWDQYVLSCPQSSGYHLMGWRGIIEEAFGHHTIYLMAQNRNEKVQGILPLVFLSGRLFGRFLVSIPFLNYGGVLSESIDAQKALLDAAAAVARECGASHIELRHEGTVEIAWPCKQHKVSMRLNLPPDFEALRKEFSSKLRSQIRRARREGMTVRFGRGEALEDFYSVFSRNMRDLGTPVYGKSFFRKILHHFPKDALICVVTLREQPLAAGFLYGFRKALEIIWASSDRRFNRLSPNMLLYNSALEYACREGFRIFDFGRSSPESGTFRFKEQWGAKPVPLHWYYWMKDGGPLPNLNPTNARFKLAVELWKRMPLGLSRWIGPKIVKYIP
jgi:FemAB-related protein (PEP-CTERM system-associated)